LDDGGRSKDERPEEGVEKEETELPSDELNEKVDSAEEDRELGRELGITRDGRDERDRHDEEEENADDLDIDIESSSDEDEIDHQDHFFKLALNQYESLLKNDPDNTKILQRYHALLSSHLHSPKKIKPAQS